MKYQALVWALVGAGSLNTFACSAEVGGGAEGSDYLEASSELSVVVKKATRLYVPPPSDDAVLQIEQLQWKARESKKKTDRDAYYKQASQIETLIATPTAVWFTEEKPKDVKKAVERTVKDAAKQKALPVLVPYNLPFRDCAQYSAGGATTAEEYKAWIDAFVAGLGSKNEAVVILEPDSLGIIPWYNPFADRDNWLADPNVLEWCQPPEADPATAASERFELVKYAVHELKTKSKAKVYLDGTHSGWLGAGDVADRLLQAGVQEADGFYLNVSNYQETARLEKYGTWIAKCVWFADTSSGSWGGGHAEWCGSQYSPANPDDFTTWTATDQWYADNVENQTWVPYPGNDGLKRFVIDSSRNGTGPLDVTPYGAAPFNQPPEVLATLKTNSWCNPPGAGLGLRPQAPTAVPLLDAYLWIKVPGESDGQCDTAGGVRAWDFNLYNPWRVPAKKQATFDPLWGQVDPAAGEWFQAQTLDLIANAVPTLPPAP